MSHRGAIGSSPMANAVVRSQQELAVDAARGAEAADQGMLQCTGSRRCLARARQVPTEKLTRVAVDDQSQRSPSALASLDTEEIGGPVLVRRGCDGRQRLDGWPHDNGTFADLSVLQLEYPLHRVLVEAQQEGRRAVAKRWVLLDHGLDRLGEAGIDLCGGLGRLVVDRPSRNAKPSAELHQRHPNPVR